MGAKVVTLVEALGRNVASLGHHPHAGETLACERSLSAGDKSSADAMSLSLLGNPDQLDFAPVCRPVEAADDKAAVFLGDERDAVGRGLQSSTQPGNIELPATIAVEAWIGEEPGGLKALARDRCKPVECG